MTDSLNQTGRFIVLGEKDMRQEAMEEQDFASSGRAAGGNIVLAKYLPLSGRGEITPLPEFRENMIGDGFINIFPDMDDKIRKILFLSTQPVEGGLLISPSFSLEGLNKTYGTTIIVSQHTWERLDDRFVLRELDVVRVKAKDDAITVFELIGFSDDIDRNIVVILKIFERGLAK